MQAKLSITSYLPITISIYFNFTIKFLIIKQFIIIVVLYSNLIIIKKKKMQEKDD